MLGDLDPVPRSLIVLLFDPGQVTSQLPCSTQVMTCFLICGNHLLPSDHFPCRSLIRKDLGGAHGKTLLHSNISYFSFTPCIILQPAIALPSCWSLENQGCFLCGVQGFVAFEFYLFSQVSWSHLPKLSVMCVQGCLCSKLSALPAPWGLHGPCDGVAMSLDKAGSNGEYPDFPGLSSVGDFWSTIF